MWVLFVLLACLFVLVVYVRVLPCAVYVDCSLRLLVACLQQCSVSRANGTVLHPLPPLSPLWLVVVVFVMSYVVDCTLITSLLIC